MGPTSASFVGAESCLIKIAAWAEDSDASSSRFNSRASTSARFCRRRPGDCLSQLGQTHGQATNLFVAWGQ